MSNAQNAHDLGAVIDFIEQDIRKDDPFTSAVLTFTANVWKHSKVRGGIDQPEQNPLGCVRAAGKQVINDGGLMG